MAESNAKVEVKVIGLDELRNFVALEGQLQDANAEIERLRREADDLREDLKRQHYANAAKWKLHGRDCGIVPVFYKPEVARIAQELRAMDEGRPTETEQLATARRIADAYKSEAKSHLDALDSLAKLVDSLQTRLARFVAWACVASEGKPCGCPDCAAKKGS